MSQNDVISYVMAKLAADRVDKCTEEVKTCLQKEDHCGEDYANCVGLDTDTILDFCPAESLMACQDKHKADKVAVRDYVARVAQGLALSIDNNFQEVCQNAAKEAMIKVCGSEDECTGFTFDNNIGSSSLKYQVCQIVQQESGALIVDSSKCKSDVSLVTEQELGLDRLAASSMLSKGSEYGGSHSWGFGVAIPFLAFGGGGSDSQYKVNYVRTTNYVLKETDTVLYSPMISGTLPWGTSINIEEDANGKLTFVNALPALADDASEDKKLEYESVNLLVLSLNNTLNNIMSTIESDPTVDKCMNGKTFQSFSSGDSNNMYTNAGMRKGKVDSKDSVGDATSGRFKNLTKTLRQTAANQVYTSALNNYNTKMAELESKRAEDYLTLSSKYDAVMAKNDATALDQRNGTACNSLSKNLSDWNYKEVVTALYNEGGNTCTKTTKTQKCKKEKYASNPGKRYCEEWDKETETTQTIQM